MLDLSEAPAEEAADSRDPRGWLPILNAYREPSFFRGVFELAVTFAAFAALWTAMWWTLSISVFLTVLIAVPTAAFVVRLFIIQHDCGHGAFFRNKVLNDFIGRALGVLTMTPYDVWKRAHAIHHATSGTLDRRGVGDITTLTVREYKALSFRRRMAYRLYRHPLVMFGIGPAYMFLLQHRLPIGFTRVGLKPWISAMATNAAIVAGAVFMMWLVGVWQFLLIHTSVVALGASLGVWLFYVQHQFEHTVWERNEDWGVTDSAFYGSSYYDLPAVLRWMTGSIGVHHVHHLCSKIPYYRLQQVMRDNPELRNIRRITLLESLNCVRLTLWDETSQRLVSFREALAPEPRFAG